MLKFVREDPAAAKEDLLRAAASGDPAVSSLAHLILGTIADRADDGEEALRRFRLAFEAAPSSASSVALASRLYRSGQIDDATVVLRVFDATAPSPDPWELYGQRDFRFFGAYKAQMRRGVAR